MQLCSSLSVCDRRCWMKPLPCSGVHDGCRIFYELGRTGAWKHVETRQIYADLTTKHGKHGVRGPFWRELEFGGPLHPGINRRLWPSWDVHSPAPWLHWPEFACAMRHKLQNQATDKSWLQPEQLVGSGSLMLVLEYIEYILRYIEYTFPRSQGM